MKMKIEIQSVEMCIHTYNTHTHRENTEKMRGKQVGIGGKRKLSNSYLKI
jgi:hypothetical protein